MTRDSIPTSSSDSDDEPLSNVKKIKSKHDDKKGHSMSGDPPKKVRIKIFYH
jgi:hypothetical protein